MSVKDRDIRRLRRIVDYCEDIARVLEVLSCDKNRFYCEKVFQKVIAFDVLQIGELVATLTEDFKEANPQIPWGKIKSLRNVIAHHYGAVDYEELWKIVHLDVPQLKDYCVKVIGDEPLEM